jgi:hypothetical protein
VAKKAPKTKQIERQGIALIATACADLAHLWNETQNDVGIDGWIELVEKATEAATGRIILVQSKATGIPFAPGAPVTFTCSEEDLRYWLNGNAPVILVRSHASSGEAYFVSIKDYFREHPEHREARRIVFDREHDRFDASSEARLWEIARSRSAGLHLGPPPVRESLTSNLLTVERMPDVIYVAPAAVVTPRHARSMLRDQGAPPPKAWTMWSGSVFSFHDPATTLIGRICNGPAEQLEVSEWADSEEPDVQRHFVHLLNGALEEQLRPAARPRKNPDVLILSAPRELAGVELPGLGGQTRGVVKIYSRDDGTIKYVRHLAMERRFKRYGDQWFLEVLPTYFFSSDGWWEAHFASDYLSKIKRIERHADMRRHVQTWTWILHGEVDLGGLAPDPECQLLEFGSPVVIEVDHEDADTLPVETEADSEPLSDIAATEEAA